MHSSLAIQTERDAWVRLSDESFLVEWQALFEACAWSTTFQSPDFVRLWFEHYQGRYAPVLVYQAVGERLIGLLILGHSAQTRQLVVAGGYQAEYQAWLEHPGGPGDFILPALQAIACAFPRYELKFKYLPKFAPAGQFIGSDKLHRRIGVMAYPCLFTTLNQDTVCQIFSNKRNQRSLKQLKKCGQLEFRRVQDAEALATILDEIIAFYDFRQGAVHDRTPFLSDVSKKAFHLDLLKKHPELLHVTVTTLNGNILAGHVGILSKNQLHLGIIAFSPFYAHCSPGIVHMMLLCELLFHEGITHLDLTPGADPTKERFANGCDQVNLITLHRDWRAQAGAALKAKGIQFIKSRPGSFGLPEERAQAIYNYAKQFHFRQAGRRLSRLLWGKSEAKVYRFYNQTLAPPSALGSINRDRLSDLVGFVPDTRLTGKQAFLVEAMDRLKRNEHFYTLVIDERLAFCGWLGWHEKEYYVCEVQQAFRVQENSPVLDLYYCDPGLLPSDYFQAVMAQIFCDVIETSHGKPLFIVTHPPDCLMESGGSDHLGWEYLRSFNLRRFLGVTRRWSSPNALEARWAGTPYTQDI